MTDSTNTKEERYPVSEALRDAGFVPLPRLWVKTSDMPKIHKIAHAYQEEVNGIRSKVYDRLDNPPRPSKPDPKTDRDAAWEAFQRLRDGV